MKKLPQISEAEYEIMKIVWKYAPINTNEITEKLTRTTSWSPKTIQTMIIWSDIITAISPLCFLPTWKITGYRTKSLIRFVLSCPKENGDSNMADFMIRFLLSNLFLGILIGMLAALKWMFRRTLSGRMQYHLWFRCALFPRPHTFSHFLRLLSPVEVLTTGALLMPLFHPLCQAIVPFK